jgi:hypothetical protein
MRHQLRNATDIVSCIGARVARNAIALRTGGALLGRHRPDALVKDPLIDLVFLARNLTGHVKRQRRVELVLGEQHEVRGEHGGEQPGARVDQQRTVPFEDIVRQLGPRAALELRERLALLIASPARVGRVDQLRASGAGGNAAISAARSSDVCIGLGSLRKSTHRTADSNNLARQDCEVSRIASRKG